MWTNIPNVLQPNYRPGFDPADWKKTSSGLYLPAYVDRKARFDRPIAIDLFSGAGGFSLGLMQAGFHVIAGLEWDAASAITYMHNLGAYPCQIVFDNDESKARLEKALKREKIRWEGYVKEGKESYPDNYAFLDELSQYHPVLSGGGWISHHGDEVPGVLYLFFGDVRNFSGQMMLETMGLERGDVDCICGGPPCQGFSRAGKRDVMDPRNSFIRDFTRLIIEIYPKTMVMENVPDILTMITPEGLNVIDEMCLTLEEGGFASANALKKTLTQNNKARVGMRGKNVGKVSQPDKDEEEGQQLTLF